MATLFQLLSVGKIGPEYRISLSSNLTKWQHNNKDLHNIVKCVSLTRRERLCRYFEWRYPFGYEMIGHMIIQDWYDKIILRKFT